MTTPSTPKRPGDLADAFRDFMSAMVRDEVRGAVRDAVQEVAAHPVSIGDSSKHFAPPLSRVDTERPPTLPGQRKGARVRPVTAPAAKTAKPHEDDVYRTTFDRWVLGHQLTSQKVAEMGVSVCEMLGLPTAGAPARKTIDDYRTGRHTPSALAILILRHVTGGEVDVEHWVFDMLNRPDHVPPRRPGPTPGKAALAAEYVALGMNQIDAADKAGCSRQAVSQFVAKHGVPEIAPQRRVELLAELSQAGVSRGDLAKLGGGGKPSTPRKRRKASGSEIGT